MSERLEPKWLQVVVVMAELLIVVVWLLLLLMLIRLLMLFAGVADGADVADVLLMC